MLKDATHIVTDVLPEDAEAQMRRRADKEIASIRAQLQDKLLARLLNEVVGRKIEGEISKLEAILHGGFKKDVNGLIYTSRTEWNDHNDYIDEALYPLAASQVRQTRENIAICVGLEHSTPLTTSLESIGIFTELRDDDISPLEEKRVLIII